MREFTPENTENTLYIFFGSYVSSMNFSQFFDDIHNHFEWEINISELDISIERIHTRCIGYDLYDPSDYDNYIVITRK